MVRCNEGLWGTFTVDRNSIPALGLCFVLSGVGVGNQLFERDSVLRPKRYANRYRNVNTAVANGVPGRCNLFTQALGEVCNFFRSVIRKKHQEFLSAVTVGFASMCAGTSEHLLKWKQNLPIDNDLVLQRAFTGKLLTADGADNTDKK